MDKKWNLQDIKPTTPKRKRMQTERRVTRNPEGPKRVPTETQNTSRTTTGGGRKNRSLVIAGVVFVLVILIGFAAGFLVSGADVTVYPKNRQPNVNATFQAYKTPTGGDLAYEVMTLEAEGERQVRANGEEEVVAQATGNLTIYKTTEGSERLIKNTRFESPDGLIYRITESVVVPGGTAEVPGKITAKAFADAPGEAYNIGPTRFTIPGFEENDLMALYNSMYAENEVAFTGGFNGTKFVTDEAELEAAQASLYAELEEALRARVPSERPSGLILFDNAITFNYQSLPSTDAGDGMVTIKEKVQLQAPLFENAAFATFIAAATIPGYENEPVRIDEVDTLNFSYAEDIANLLQAESITFTLSGKPRIVWTFDQEQLRADLSGASKTAPNSILSGYPAIERIEATFRPFWQRSFPENIEKINITESFKE